MQTHSGRDAKLSFFKKSYNLLQKYSNLETVALILAYLGIGYLIDPDDICLLNGQVSYVLVFVAVVTLFHGFESGILIVSFLATAMWYFYPFFQYIHFLIIVLMVLIFSEFHYFWTKKIKEAEILANYKESKLNELSRAFYALKISHDQLEKNYVVKPMSIRYSIEKIVNMYDELTKIEDIDTKSTLYYENFLKMLEKSFSVQSGFVLYLDKRDSKHSLGQKNMQLSYSTNSKRYSDETILDDYLVDRAIDRKQAIYVSDDKGDPSMLNGKDSNFLAAIPSVIDKSVVAVLVIEKMQFMAFNRENLTSVAILLEYFTLEILEKDILFALDEISIIPDEKFRYEYTRLKQLYNTFNVNSIVLVLRMKSELQFIIVFEKIKKMLRSLDMVASVYSDNFYYIPLLFPLNQKSAALGYLNRLLNSLEEKKDKNFEYMIFDMRQTKILNKYLREDYDG